MKLYRLEFVFGMYMLYWGWNIGDVIAKMIADHPSCLQDLTNIVEEPIEEQKLP